MKEVNLNVGINSIKNKMILFWIMLVWAGCHRSDNEPLMDGVYFKVQIVDAICGVAVMEILDDQFKYLGQPEWQVEDKIYRSVFFAHLDCKDLEYFSALYRPTLIGLEIQVAIAETNQKGDCTICDATINNPPSVTYFIDIGRK